MIRPACIMLALAFAVGAPAAWADIRIASVTSPGGIEAWLYEEHSIPLLTIDASFLGGPGFDPEGREGTTSLMAALLDEGAGGLDSVAFSTKLEDLVARISFYTGGDDVRLSATMLTEARDGVTDLLRLALTEPRFDTGPVERLRAQTLAAIQQSDADPQTRAYTSFYAQAFPGHPYGRPAQGTEASVTAISVDGLRAVQKAVFTRAHLRVAVVGDITPGELGPLLDHVFGALPETGPELPAVATPQLSGKTTVIDIDASQSVVVFGNAGFLPEDPDIIPAMLLNYVLGGGSLGSRLGAEMRVKRGLTYGVNTWLASGSFGGLYLGTFSSSTERVAEAIQIVRDEWARMAELGITEAELASAKRYLTGEFPLRFQGSAEIAEQLLALQLFGHDPGYVTRRSNLIEAVTVEDIARVARRLVQPDALTVVIAGRMKGLEPGN